MEADGKSVAGESRCESYKRRTKAHFGNPLKPPNEHLVDIPKKEKSQPFRTPFYVGNNDLIANGVGENARGIPKNNPQSILLGH